MSSGSVAFSSRMMMPAMTAVPLVAIACALHRDLYSAPTLAAILFANRDELASRRSLARAASRSASASSSAVGGDPSERIARSSTASTSISMALVQHRMMRSFNAALISFPLIQSVRIGLFASRRAAIARKSTSAPTSVI